MNLNSSASWEEIRAWRKQTRSELIERRLAMAPEERARLGDAAKRSLRDRVELNRYHTLGIYWPFRGEIDVRDLAREHIAAGRTVALPVVVTKAAPIEFWRWEPGMKLARGVWNIPIPPQREVVRPDALIVPLVGFDAQRYRLGYGGGYYDRTLATFQPRPFCIGLGYARFQLESIHPQPHDIAMDMIVTDEFVWQP
jgi:5-formyltetrahydrofolate cyclo-ligase